MGKKNTVMQVAVSAEEERLSIMLRSLAMEN
jgi:hypothetical protein